MYFDRADLRRFHRQACFRSCESSGKHKWPLRRHKVGASALLGFGGSRYRTGPDNPTFYHWHVAAGDECFFDERKSTQVNGKPKGIILGAASQAAV
jgi:hypothetical protein